MMQQLPKPILFHPLKHHLGYIRAFAQESVSLPEQELRRFLRTIGGSQLDLYTGPLSPLQLSEEVVLHLQGQDLLSPAPFRRHLTPSDYRLCTLSDGSAWALRWGVQEGRHIHLHPARYSPHTLRVKANHLKTAIAVAIATRKYNASPSLPLLNQVREAWLALPPVQEYVPTEGLGRALSLLQ